MNFKSTILLCILINLALGFDIKKKLKEKSEKLKKKMNKFMKNKKGEKLFLDTNEFEYPRNNETLREIHREQWLEYYECLKKNYARAGSQKTIYPVALMALGGTSIQLECDVCTSPAEVYIIELVEWYFNSSSNSSVANEPVELTEHMLISPEDKSLLMYNIQPDQSGGYWCNLGDTLGVPYFVHVDNGSEPTEMVRPNEALQATHASPPTIISRYNLKAYSSWTEWTECSTCNKVGKKIRYGYCTISVVNTSTEKSIPNESTRKMESNSSSQLDKRDTIKDEQKEDEDSNEIAALVEKILPLFRNTMPCRSPKTPKIIQNIEEIRNRKTEIMVRFCKIKCEKNVIFEVRDKSGNVLESANNSAGIYSMHQGIPDPPPTVTRITIYQKHGTKTTLKCPGNLNSDTPFLWQIGNKVISAKLISEQSGGRISINVKNELEIKKLRFADANIYSCWQNEALAGTVRLEVTEELEIEFNHHVFMIGAIIILSVFLYVFWKAFRGRKRITKH